MLLLTRNCTSVPAQCRQADIAKSAPAQYKCHYYLASPQSLSKKQIKTKLMLCKLIFIVHGRVKGFLKVIATTVQKRSTSVEKIGVAHA